MKKLHHILVVAGLALGVLTACKSGSATLTGEIKDYKAAGIECMLITDSSFVQDSVDIAKMEASHTAEIFRRVLKYGLYPRMRKDSYACI